MSRIAIIGGIIIVWFSSLFWVPEIARRIILHSPDCRSITATVRASNSNGLSAQCDAYAGAVGIAGDMFGAVNALFSALALVAVALAFSEDIKARREDKKPLIVYNYNNNVLIMKNPKFVDTKSIDLVVEGEIDSLGEPALNITVDCFLICRGNHKIDIGKRPILPIGQSDSSDLKIIGNISESNLRTILNTFNEGNNRLELHFEITFSSLQGTSWKTKSVYIVKDAGDSEKARIGALLSNDQTAFNSAWGNSNILSLELQVSSGNWTFEKNS